MHASAEQAAFAQPYRGWGAIGYQGNRERATTPIIQTDLVIDENYRNQIPEAPTEDDVPGFDGLYRATTGKQEPAIKEPKDKAVKAAPPPPNITPLP